MSAFAWNVSRCDPQLVMQYRLLRRYNPHWTARLALAHARLRVDAEARR